MTPAPAIRHFVAPRVTAAIPGTRLTRYGRMPAPDTRL